MYSLLILSHEYFFAFSNPALTISERWLLNLRMETLPLKSVTVKLSINKVLSPIISGIDDALYAMTGQPALCASRTGIPKPS